MRPLFLAFALALGGSAHATSQHQDAKIEAIKDARGKTVGAEISLVLMPSNHQFARVGLLPSRKAMPGTGIALKKQLMARGSKRWLHPVKNHDVSKGPVEVTLPLKYGPKLRAGGTYQLASAWDNGPGQGEHLWGVEWQAGWGDPEITLPK